MSATGRNGRGRTLAALIGLLALAGVVPAGAQSFRVQCPQYTNLHPNPQDPAIFDAHGNTRAPSPVSGALAGSTYTQAYPGKILCQQISGGDGMATMGDGHQIYLFGFGPLSGLQDIYAGLPGTQTNDVFNSGFQTTGGLPVVAAAGSGTGGIAMSAPNPNNAAVVEPAQVMSVGVLNASQPGPLMAINEDDEFFLTLTNVGMIMRPDLFEQHTVHFHGYPNASAFYDGVPDASVAINIGGSFTYYYLAPDAGTYFWHCHITPPEHLQMGMVGQLYVRPRQNRVPANASLYLASQYQNGVAAAQTGPSPTVPIDLRTTCTPSVDILCSANVPATLNTVAQGTYTTVGYLSGGNSTTVHPNAGKSYLYAYNDGDGHTQYDVEYPIQMHGFDPDFHFVGMTFNPEAFADMKDKYFLLNGRSYPDTASPGPQLTQSTDNRVHYSQPMPTIINIPAGGKALLRLVNLSVSEYHTLATLGVRMHVIGYNAKLLRDQQGNNLDYYTNSITLGGGESLDVILDTCMNRVNFDNCKGANAVGAVATAMPPGMYFLYTPNLDHLSNDAENFGGEMAEIHVN